MTDHQCDPLVRLRMFAAEMRAEMTKIEQAGNAEKDWRYAEYSLAAHHADELADNIEESRKNMRK